MTQLLKRKNFIKIVTLILFLTRITYAQQNNVTINAGETKEPISPYIYGQFIEHLGRCIYGGIWAEMLEDRKFYYPITEDYNPYRRSGGIPQDSQYQVVGASPWQIIGPADGVTMVEEDSFAGEHTPLIQAGSGIRQLDLGLVKDKDYSGYIYLKAVEANLSVTVSLTWGDNQNDSIQFDFIQNEYVKYPFWLTSGADTTSGALEIGIEGGSCFVGTVSIMPADNINGLRADTLKVLKELNATLYRWPGGNFVSGYDWRDGIGDRDKRPPRTNPAWTGVEHNDFGIHEFINFCRILNAEPMITVNTGFGDAYSAAAELEYANGATDTQMGSLRKLNGDSEPFNVRSWCIGNEMWGAHQLGYMSINHYILKHNLVVDKMREVDPDIVCIASGNAGDWSRRLLQGCTDSIDAMAEHYYITRTLPDVAAHVDQLVQRIRDITSFHRDLRQQLDLLDGKDIKVAMTEWNYWNYNTGRRVNDVDAYMYGELGRRYFMQDALGIAAGLHEYYRQSDIMLLATYAQTVNVIGCVKASKTAAEFAATGLPLKLYRNEYGTIPVEITSDYSPLDIAVAWTQDRDYLTISIINPTNQQQQVNLDINDVNLSGAGKLWQIANPDPMAYNTPGEEPNIVIQETEISNMSEQVTVPVYSISLYKIEVQ